MRAFLVSTLLLLSACAVESAGSEPSTDTGRATPRDVASAPEEQPPAPDVRPNLPPPPDVDAPCVPDCDGFECGDDGCGGSCGKCPTSVPFCTPEGLCGVDHCKRYECGIAVDGSDCGTCPAAAPHCHGASYFDCAAPPCTRCEAYPCDWSTCGNGVGGECGPDGCGGVCGTCAGDLVCKPVKKGTGMRHECKAP